MTAAGVLRALALTLALCLALAAPAARAQEAATLVADRVEVRSATLLVAEGNVEVFWRGARLVAQRITYDRAADRLTIEGPIVLTDGEQTSFFADSAELSTDLRDGLMRGARLVLAQRLQLAANEIARVEGRYTELSQVVASSCQVCPEDPVPLWSIRARRVIHDQQERQIYFEGAQLRVLDIPVAFLPRLRFPDPTLERATGFLFPTLRSTSQLGTGLKVPYFVTLGRSADLLLTPYLSSRTTTLELRYRQAFRTGRLSFAGALSGDDILPGETRYYVMGGGAFALPRGYRLSFGLEAVSDDAYLVDYGYGDEDRLESFVALERTRRDEHAEARLLAYRSLREGELTSTLPAAVGEAVYERRFVPGALGGVAELRFGALAARRSSDLDVIGRDVARLSAALSWQRTEVFGPGLVATASAGLLAQRYAVEDDAAFDGGVDRVIPQAALTLRWPLARTGRDGSRQVLEPLAMLAWSPEDPDAAPNEDSTVAEFDEANLLSFSRFPGEDATEDGVRLALGLGWSRYDPAGWSMGVTVGRLIRDEAGPFGAGTGLDGTRSDWLLGLRLELPGRLGLLGRALVSDAAEVTKADLRLRYASPALDLETGFLYLASAPAENRPDEIAEWTLDALWQITPQWSTRAQGRYDVEVGRATSAGLGLGWQNECLKVDLSLSRRFTSSTSLRPTTDFALSVELTGFGGGSEGGVPRRRCMN
jgi:LPS-assembly protein